MSTAQKAKGEPSKFTVIKAVELLVRCEKARCYWKLGDPVVIRDALDECIKTMREELVRILSTEP